MVAVHKGRDKTDAIIKPMGQLLKEQRPQMFSFAQPKICLQMPLCSTFN